MARYYCSPGSIVIEIDGDDAISGKQVFNTFNRFYAKNTDLWVVYANFILSEASLEGDGRDVDVSKLDHIKEGFTGSANYQWYFLEKSYRTSQSSWGTSLGRSYLADLYKKIPLEYFIDQEKCQYYEESSDRFVAYALN